MHKSRIDVVTFELETLKMALDVMLRVVLENAPLAELAKDVFCGSH